MKNIILIISIIILWSMYSCKPKSESVQISQDNYQIEDNIFTNEKTYTLTAIVEKRNFVDKAGRVHEDIQDYYLSEGEMRYFISNCNNIFSIFNFSNFTNQIIEAEVIYKNGEWDRCPGDPPMQSRIGEYVEVYSVSLIPDNELFIYTDRSNNTWNISRNKVKYTPIAKEMSSTGIYDGGEAAEIEINDTEFVMLRNITTKMLKNKDLHIENRIKTSVIICHAIDDETESAILVFNDTVEHLEIVLGFIIGKQ